LRGDGGLGWELRVGGCWDLMLGFRVRGGLGLLERSRFF